jgi:hypothetical protein
VVTFVRPGHFAPWGGALELIGQEAGWGLEPVSIWWYMEKSLPLSGIEPLS